MRVLYHHRTQGRGVEAVHILGMCRGLRECGYQVEICGPPGVEVTEASTPGVGGKSRWGWIARNLPQTLFELLEIGYNLAAVPRLVRRVRELRPDFLYERYALYNAAGVLAARLTGTPLVLEINETVDVDRERQGKRLTMSGLARWFERRIFRGAAGIVAVSGYLRAQAVARGVAPERVQVTPNAVDPAWFDPARFSGRKIREKLGWTGATVVGFAGSFARWHRIDLLIRAFAHLAPEHPELRLLLIGDGLYRPATEELVRELGIPDRVLFTGRVSHTEIPSYLGALDIGVMPASNVFGSPMKVFEYMAMGRPTLAPRLGPLEEAIRDGEHGYLFEPNSEAALTGCLRALVSDPDRMRRMGEAARAKVLGEHQWVHNARTTLSLLPHLQGAPAPEEVRLEPALP